jgi:hypothetical protein
MSQRFRPLKGVLLPTSCAS